MKKIFCKEIEICFRAQYDAVGGRCVADLMDLADFAKLFTHVFVIVGDNDAAQRTINFILGRFLQFKNAIWPTRVKFAGNMRRHDLNPVLVANNNIYLSEKLGVQHKSTKLIKREDFHIRKKFHFDWYGKGYSHMAAMILSVFDEFVSQW